MADAKLHRTRNEIESFLPNIASSPKDNATIEMIVVRPAHGERATPKQVEVSIENGVDGDHWSKGCWLKTESGAPHPDVQINLMNSRAAGARSGDAANWPAAGNNFFVDIDLSLGNLPPGTLLGLGSAEIEITNQPNKGCQIFIDHYGRDACIFVNTGPGWSLRMRGLYARVVKDGKVRLGDQLRKLQPRELSLPR